jgi:quinol monooxygenase YgiN
MLIIAGHLLVEPVDRESYLVDCAPAVEAARSAAGCLDFALSADLLDPARINVHERWESDELLLAFRGSGPDDDTAARVVGADVHKYRISTVEAS